MSMRKPVEVDADDLETAFQFVSFGAPTENQAFISRETGKIFCKSSSYTDEDEELPDDIDEPDLYIEIPHKTELGLGRRLVFDFVASELPGDYDTVERYFRRRGAYGRFKALLERRHKLEQWYHFENTQEREALREWCMENEIVQR